MKFIIIFYFNVFIISTSNNLRKFSSLIGKEKNELDKKFSNTSRNLENNDKSDNYILLYFKKNCSYPIGFKNDFRNDISFIINRENNLLLTNEQTLIIDKDLEYEIHFNKTVKNLEYFFSASIDENMENLLSIDFANFDSSLVTSMKNIFQSCQSLKSVNLSNLNTSSLLNIDEMFYGCDSLNFLDLSNFDMVNCNSYNNLFSNVNCIKFINLNNFKKDKIFSKIFNGINYNFFICQNHNIINNEKAYNCCNYNFNNNKCNSESQDEYVNYQSTIHGLGVNTNSNEEEYVIQKYIKKSTNSSSKISVIAIIGIIVGMMVVFYCVLIVICCKIKMGKHNTYFQMYYSNKAFYDEYTFFEIFQNEYVYEPEVKDHKKQIKIFLSGASHLEMDILINPDKTLTELIKFFFEKIKRPNLFGDKSIRFIFNYKHVSHDSKELIRKFINKNNEENTIIIDDLYNKIRNEKIINENQKSLNLDVSKHLEKNIIKKCIKAQQNDISLIANESIKNDITNLVVNNYEQNNLPIKEKEITNLDKKSEPEVKSENNKIKILLTTTSQRQVEILIDPDKTATELIQIYFEKINRLDLFGDESIRFLISAKLILHDSKDLIKNYINKGIYVNIITVDDVVDKIVPEIKCESFLDTNQYEYQFKSPNLNTSLNNKSKDLNKIHFNKNCDSDKIFINKDEDGKNK